MLNAARECDLWHLFNKVSATRDYRDTANIKKSFMLIGNIIRKSLHVSVIAYCQRNIRKADIRKFHNSFKNYAQLCRKNKIVMHIINKY